MLFSTCTGFCLLFLTGEPEDSFVITIIFFNVAGDLFSDLNYAISWWLHKMILKIPLPPSSFIIPLFWALAMFLTIRQLKTQFQRKHRVFQGNLVFWQLEFSGKYQILGNLWQKSWELTMLPSSLRNIINRSNLLQSHESLTLSISFLNRRNLRTPICEISAARPWTMTMNNESSDIILKSKTVFMLS